MFTVLTRTSNRPRLFRQCRESVKMQTLPAWHIVSTDDPNDAYPEGDEVIQVMPEPGRGHNLYFNTMRQYVPLHSPFVIFLDDDDFFTSPYALETIREAIFDRRLLILWQVMGPDGRLIPDEIPAGPPTFGNITGIGMCFHVNYWVNWQAVPGGDFRVISELYTRLRPMWINGVLTQMAQVGHGLKQDADI